MGDLFQPSHLLLVLVLILFPASFYVFYQSFNKPGREQGQRLLMSLVCTLLLALVLGMLGFIALSQLHTLR